MTQKLDTLKKVLGDIAARSKEAHETPNWSSLEKDMWTRMYDAKADAVLEVGIAMLSMDEYKKLRDYRNNVIDLY